MKSHPTSCGAEGQAGQGELDLAMGVLKRPQDSIWVTQCRAPCPRGIRPVLRTKEPLFIVLCSSLVFNQVLLNVLSPVVMATPQGVGMTTLPRCRGTTKAGRVRDLPQITEPVHDGSRTMSCLPVSNLVLILVMVTAEPLPSSGSVLGSFTHQLVLFLQLHVANSGISIL